MNITINGEALDCAKETTTVAEIAEIKGISAKGTAIAINGRICKADAWTSTNLKDGDAVTVISAAFGG